MIGQDRRGHSDARGALRFLTELIAWVAVPWALWPHVPGLAIAAVVLLIGLPAVLGTPGDRPGGGILIVVPGTVTILFVLIQLVSATTAAWALWPWWAAVPVTALCLVVPVTERPRWRRLTGTAPVHEGVPVHQDVDRDILRQRVRPRHALGSRTQVDGARPGSNR